MPSFSKEFTLDLTIDCIVIPGSPGRLSGPPEDCYPAEGPEVDSWSIDLDDDQRKALARERIDPALAARVLAILLRDQIDEASDEALPGMERDERESWENDRAEAHYDDEAHGHWSDK